VPALAGFFYKGLYLKETPDGIISPKKILSLGGSVDWQKGANVTMKGAPSAEDAGSTREVDETKDTWALTPISSGICRLVKINRGHLRQVDFYYLQSRRSQ